MSLVAQLQEKIVVAMKEKDKETLATLRGLKSMVQNEEIKLKKPLTPDEELTVINREVKQTTEELSNYEQATGDYAEPIAKLTTRLTLLKTFLPTQLTTQEIEAIVQKAIDEIGATGKSDMGKVMSQIMPTLKGKANGKVINQVVSTLLAK